MTSNKMLYRRLVAPLSAQIEVTSNCNCRCQHCYNFWRDALFKASKKSNMDMSTARKCVKEIKKNILFSAVITGGEPFLNFPVVSFLAEELLKDDIDISLNTNLSILNYDQAKWIKDNNIHVLTSVLGDNEELHDFVTQLNGSFEQTISGIEKLISLDVYPSVNVVITKLNASHLADTIEMLCKIGVKTVAVTPATQPDYCNDFSKYALSREEIVDCYNILVDYHEKYGIFIDTLTNYPLCGLVGVRDISHFLGRSCTIGRSQIVIASDGSCRECPHTSECLGNIHTQELSTIWKSCERWCYSNTFPKECLECKLFGMCNGGCRVAAKKFCGNMTSLDPKAYVDGIDPIYELVQNCQKHKAIIPSGIFHINPYKVRKESFGYTIGTGKRFASTKLISNEAYNELIKFVVGRSYKTCDVLNSYTKEDKETFLFGMASRGILSFEKED